MRTVVNAQLSSTDNIVVVTDPFEIVDALCDAEEWDLARKLAREHDAARH